MTTCTAPRCSAPARWRVTGTDRVVCGEHIPDSTPVEAIPDDTILAAVCPPGWRRDPMNGRPVMPCLGKLLFPCAPDEVPTHAAVRAQVYQLWDGAGAVNPCWLHLLGAIIGDARSAKVCDMPGLSQDTEKYLADCIDEVLRTCRGTVRIVKKPWGWKEVTADAAATGEEGER